MNKEKKLIASELVQIAQELNNEKEQFLLYARKEIASELMLMAKNIESMTSKELTASEFQKGDCVRLTKDFVISFVHSGNRKFFKGTVGIVQGINVSRMVLEVKFEDYQYPLPVDWRILEIVK